MASQDPFIVDIEKETKENTNFRKVLFTSSHEQLVVMHLVPGEDIGEEVHTLDQFIRIEAGEGKAVLNTIEYPLSDGIALVIPANTRHNIINTSDTLPLKLYTVYAPPNHKDGVIHETKADALRDHDDEYSE